MGFILDNIPVRKENIKAFLEKNKLKLSNERIIELISKIENDDDKIEMIKKYIHVEIDAYSYKIVINENNIIDILSTIKNADKIAEVFDAIKGAFNDITSIIKEMNYNEDLVFKIIESFSYENERRYNINVGLRKYNMFNTIFELSEEKKLEYLDKFNVRNLKYSQLLETLKTFNLDENKLKLISNHYGTLKEESGADHDQREMHYIVDMIKSLKDDNNKLKVVELFSSKLISKYESHAFIDYSGDFYIQIASLFKDKDCIIKLLELLDNNRETIEIEKNMGEYKYTYASIDKEQIFQILAKNNNANLDAEYLIRHPDYINALPLTNELIENTNFQKILFEKLSNLVNDYSLDKKELYLAVLRRMAKTNDELLTTINFKMFSQKYLNLFMNSKDGVLNLSVICRYPNIQEKIIKLGEANYPLCNILIRNITSLDCDYTKVLNDCLDDSILSILIKVNSLNGNELNEFIKKLMYVTSNLSNVLGTLDFDKIMHYEKYIDEILNEKLKNPKEEKDLKEAILLKRYGIDYETAVNLLDRFATNLDSINVLDNQVYMKIKVLLNDIKIIVEETDENELYIASNLETERIPYDSLIVLEATCRKMYGELLANKLASVEQMKKLDYKFSKYNHDIYFAYDEEKKNDFYIMLTVLGAYSNFERPENYAQDWSRPKLGTHGFCASLINNQMMGTARLKYACLGFSNIPSSSLLLQAPYDMNSRNTKMDITKDAAYSRSQFMSPEALIDYTNHTHNELVIERLLKEGKLKPSYTIFMTEEFDKDRLSLYEKITSEDLDNIEEYLKCGRDHNGVVKKIFDKYQISLIKEHGDVFDDLYATALEIQYWVNTIKASNDFGIPVVVVERKKVRMHELEVVNGMMEEFKKTHNADLMLSTITRFKNNYFGYYGFHAATGFSDESKFINKIYDEINDMIKSDDLKNAQECIDKLISAPSQTILEFDNNILLGMKEKIEEKIELLKKGMSTKNIDNTDFKREISEIQNDETITASIDMDGYSMSEIEERYEQVEDIVKNAISDEERKNAYNFASKSHGDNHIQDVILFTALVGQDSLKAENKDRLLELAIEASKYHDCGRIDDYSEYHAAPGANKAYHILKASGKYSELELAFIYTAIYNHEYSVNPNDMSYSKKQLEYDSILKLKNSFLGIVKYGDPTKFYIPWTDLNEKEYQDALKDAISVGSLNPKTVNEDLMKIVTLVRDADALDRTRFLDHSRAGLNVHYLSDDAIKFVNFSSKLAEYHAKKDLERLKEKGKIDDDLIKRIIENPKEFKSDFIGSIKSNKELIKFIRDNNIYLEGVVYK